MSKRTGRKPKRERTTKRRTRRHSSTSESSADDVSTPPPPPPKSSTKTRSSSRVKECEKKVALTIKLPKPAEGTGDEENTSGMWKVECSNGSDGDIQKLKISLRRSPKDLLREQAAEEKRKEKETACSSANSSVLDGSVTNYLEQFGSTIAVEETELSIMDPNEQVQVVIPTNELPFQEETNKINNDHVDNSGVLSEFITLHEEPVKIENISIDDNKPTDEIVSEPVCETNIVQEVIKDPTVIAVESIKPCSSPKEIQDLTVQSSVIECSILEDKSVHMSEDKSSNITITNIVSSNVDIPVSLSETIQDIVKPESIENITESNTSEVIKVENVSTIEISKTTNVTIKEPNNTDVINESEQMEDVVQLTVESPDLVDDDDPKPVYEEESKSVHEKEVIPVYEEEATGQVDEKESKLIDKKEIEPVEESYTTLLSSNTTVTKHINVEKESKLDETPKLLSSHPKRKWGCCKTRIPITINPFTLGTIIDSNGDSIGDNGEYRSEEGEIQRTDSDDEQDADEPMEINDTMLIDHEAVDYEAPDEEEKPDNYNDESKSDKSFTEDINEEPKKKLFSVKRTNTSCVIRITNLVRPFTVGQLRDLLQRTGKIVANGFWIDTIKSQCIVEYENEDQAIETVYALNESQWPSTNPKFLRVVFTDKEELNKALNGTYPDKLSKPKESLKVEKLKTQLDNHIILREWDRGKLEDINGEKEGDKSIKRKISNDSHIPKEKKAKKDVKDLLDKRKKSKTKTPERIPTKSLDELFRKTKTTPTLYWCPLSIEQITEKEDQRRKHLAEMERTQKPDRRRRDNIHYPRRR